jgi:alpha-beta hydrolase superfamily lysophospholipase
MRQRGRLIALGGLLLLGAVALYGVGWQLSRPVPVSVGAPPTELDAELVAFPSESGSTVRGWLSRGAAKRGAVLLLPGIRENRLSMVERAKVLRNAGYATLLIDFQATGESPGDVITFGWRERFDVLAAVQMLRRRLPGERVGVIGISLGGAATLFAARDLDVDAVVLESVYPSIDVAVGNRLRRRFGPLGSMLSPLLLVQLRPRLGISASVLRPIDYIGSLTCPLLIVGGEVDHQTTPEDTRRLYDAASGSKEIWLIPGAGHVDYLRTAREEYTRRVLRFLRPALASD